MKLVVDDKIMKTRDEFKLIDSEKALVTVRPGTLWAFVKQGDDNVGIAFHGSAKFAIDAIVETEWSPAEKFVDVSVYVTYENSTPKSVTLVGSNCDCEIVLLSGVVVKVLDRKSGKIISTLSGPAKK